MKKFVNAAIILIQFSFIGVTWSQQNLGAVNCDGAVPGCDLPSFYISTNNSQNYQDFGTGTGSNPTSNPNAAPGNSGCLLSGETTSTFITINVVTTGVLEWSIQAPQTACLDWAMWPYSGLSTCTDLQNGTQAPIACNWNGACGGYTGMASPGNLPVGASQSDFEYGLNVVAGETYLLCLSNYSGISQPVNFDFFGTADVSCSANTPDQTICLGDSAIVNVTVSTQVPSPTYNWLVTNGVSNVSGGSGVIVTPLITTDYIVEISDPSLANPILDTFTITVVNPPVPNAGIDQTTCLGDPIQLSGTADDPINNTLIWQTDASAVNPVPVVNYSPNTSSLNPVVTTNQTGTYLFILSESNAICGNINDTVEVSVSDLQIAATVIEPSCNGLSDGEIHITSMGAIEYSFDNGITWQADSFEVNFSAGSYLVCARTATGCQKCLSVDLTDPAIVTIAVSNDTTICENGTGYLIATATGGTSYLYYWDFTSNTNASQTVNPSVNTTYTVYVENENGCASPTETIEVTVRPPLTGTISLWDTVCPTYSTDLSATVTGGLGAPYTFVWSSSDTQTGPDNHTITVTPASTTTYSVTITDECESTPLVLNTNVRVSPLPVPQYQVLNPEQCEPAIFDIVNTTDPTLSQYVYWSVGNQYQFLNQDTIITPEMWNGDYDIQMIVTSFEGCVDSLNVLNALYVHPTPIADFKYSPDPVTIFSTTVNFVNYSVNGDIYQWSFEDGYPSESSQTNVQVEFPDGIADTYDIELIATSLLGCADTLIVELIVLPEIIIYAPNTFTPDGDQFNQNWRIFMEGNDIYDFELLIFNRWGEIIWESHDINVSWDGTYKGKVLPQGTYNWIVRTKDGWSDDVFTYNGSVNIIK